MARLGVEQLVEISDDEYGTVIYGLDENIEIESPESVNGAAGTCEYSIGIVSSFMIVSN